MKLPKDIIQDEIYPYISLSQLNALTQPINPFMSSAICYWHLLHDLLLTLTNHMRQMAGSMEIIQEFQGILKNFIYILEKEIFPDRPQKIYAFRNALLFGKSVLPLYTQQIPNPEDSNKLFDGMMDFFDRVDAIALPTNHEESVLELSVGSCSRK